jgi:hypothetical protein
LIVGSFRLRRDADAARGYLASLGIASFVVSLDDEAADPAPEIARRVMLLVLPQDHPQALRALRAKGGPLRDG